MDKTRKLYYRFVHSVTHVHGAGCLVMKKIGVSMSLSVFVFILCAPRMKMRARTHAHTRTYTHARTHTLGDEDVSLRNVGQPHDTHFGLP